MRYVYLCCCHRSDSYVSKSFLWLVLRSLAIALRYDNCFQIYNANISHKQPVGFETIVGVIFETGMVFHIACISWDS